MATHLKPQEGEDDLRSGSSDMYNIAEQMGATHLHLSICKYMQVCQREDDRAGDAFSLVFFPPTSVGSLLALGLVQTQSGDLYCISLWFSSLLYFAAVRQ